MGSRVSREVTLQTEVTTRKTQFAVRWFAKFLGTPWVLGSAEREMTQTESNITLDQVHGSTVREIFSDTMGSRVQQI